MSPLVFPCLLTAVWSLGWPLDNQVTQNLEAYLRLGTISVSPPLRYHEIEACGFSAFLQSCTSVLDWNVINKCRYVSKQWLISQDMPQKPKGPHVRHQLLWARGVSQEQERGPEHTQASLPASSTHILLHPLRSHALLKLRHCSPGL